MAGPRGLVQWVDQELHKSGLLPRKARLLVAVSGGADSVGLLRLLVEINKSKYWGWRLVAGHVDHGIRGRASAGDAKFVRGLARELGLRFLSVRLKLGREASEDVARERRLRALARMARMAKCAAVVMGHHGDDQAETVLMRMMRGCGLEGLAGMRERTEIGRMVILRPLLGVRRAALRRFLEEIGQEWREDRTNRSDEYLRNRVRREVMPVVERIWPRGVEAVGRLARLAGEAQEMLEMEAGKFVECDVREHAQRPLGPIGQKRGTRSAAEHGTPMVVSRARLRREPAVVAGEILRRMIESAGGTRETADFERVREAVRMIRGGVGGKEIEVGGGIVVVASNGVVLLKRRKRGRR